MRPFYVDLRQFMSRDSQDGGPNMQKQEDNKEIPIHNGTHKGGPAAEGGRPPLWMGISLFVLPFLHSWSIILAIS